MAASAATNTAPSDLLVSSSSFDENTSASVTFTGVDDSTTAFTFYLSGEDAASFSIDSSTGVLTLNTTWDTSTLTPKLKAADGGAEATLAREVVCVRAHDGHS